MGKGLKVWWIKPGAQRRTEGMMDLLNIAGGIGDLVTTHCLLCKPKDMFILDRGYAGYIFHPSAPADPEGMGR
jgi:hypothetical protein